jgi:hypothetical protein
VNTLSENRAAWTPQLQPRRVRSLGEELAPPRPLYFTHIPFILAFTGTLSWVLGSDFGTVLSSLVGGVIGVYMLFDWLFRGETRFSTVIAFGLLIGYGLGAFNTWATTPRGTLSLGEYLGYDDAVLARGVATVLISCAVTILFGELFEKPLFGRDFYLRPDPRIYSLISLGTIIVFGAFAAGMLSFNGATGDETGHLGVAKSFLLWFFSPLVVLAVTVFFLTPRGGLQKKISGACAFILLILVALMGRRTMVYTVIGAVFFARISGIRFKGSLQKKIAVFAVVIVFVITCALGFMLLRIAGYQGSSKEHKSLVDRLVIVREWISEGSALDKALSSTQNNVQTRTFVLGFFANILDASGTHTPALGADAFGMVQLAIPSALYPGKDLYFSEEALTDQLFGFSYRDEANSLLTNGAADFGFLGALFFPLAVAWILRFIIEFVSWRLNQFSSLMTTMGCLLVCLGAENSLTGYVVSLIHGIIFAVGIVIFFALPRIQFRTQAASPVRTNVRGELG